MFTDKELSSNPQYNVLKIVTLLNLVQVLLHMLTGLFIIFPEMQIHAQVIVRLCGSTLNSLWLALFPPTCVLSVTRILIVHGTVSAKKMPTVMKVLLAFGWLCAFGSWLWGCITQNVFLDYVVWSYDFNKLGASTICFAEFIICIASLGVSYIAYLMLAILLHVQKKEMSNKSSSGQVRIFVQSTFTSLYMAGIVLGRHHSDFQGLWYNKTYTTTFVVHCAWILFSYLNPLLLISLNKTVRNKILVLFAKKAEPARGTTLFTNRDVSLRPSKASYIA
ncbi:hypothetical protein Aduo_011186 [Ancylostoma duodenale]